MRAPDLFRGEMYFHALPRNKKLNFNDGRVVALGKEMKASREAYMRRYGVIAPYFPAVCHFGMHACKSANECASTWLSVGGYLCAVRLSQNVVDDSEYGHKQAAMRRKVVAWRKVHTRSAINKLCKMTDREIYLWILAAPENKKG